MKTGPHPPQPAAARDARPAPSRAGDEDEPEPPPLLGRWSRLYALVLTVLALVIALLVLLTREFA